MRFIVIFWAVFGAVLSLIVGPVVGMVSFYWFGVSLTQAESIGLDAATFSVLSSGLCLLVGRIIIKRKEVC